MHWNQHEAVTPRLAAAVILLRNNGDVLLVKRNPQLRFMGGHHAFPGGSLESADTDDVVDNAASPEIGRFVCAAARELFEETGVLLARGKKPAFDVLQQARSALETQALSFPQFLKRWQLRLAAEDFIPAGVWVTPPFSPIRFHTQYFLCRCDNPEEVALHATADEIVGLDWLQPDVARRRWHMNEGVTLSTPVAFVLRHLAVFGVEQALPGLRNTPGRDGKVPNRFEPRAGIHIIPLRTPTLPPALHTSCLVLGEEELWIIDPGATDPQEQAYLDAHLQELLALGGGRIAGIVLTHAHSDHTGAVSFLQERYDVPLWAHAETARRISIPVARLLQDGEEWEIPGAQNTPGWRVQCLHTPGHDPGHMCFYEQVTGTLSCGDMIANPGTIMVSPDDHGDMADYMNSLERLVELNPAFTVPAHGLPTFRGDGRTLFQETLQHRLAREVKIKDALDAGADTLPAILQNAYADTPKALWPYAEQQLRAHLKRLGVSF